VKRQMKLHKQHVATRIWITVRTDRSIAQEVEQYVDTGSHHTL